MISKKDLFNTIYNQNKTLVYNLSLSYVQNIEDAEEITQDVFLKVYQSLENFKSHSTVSTWIYRITINKSLDYIKKKNSKKRFYVFGKKSENEYAYLSASNFNHPGIELEDKENSKILFEAINSLTENQKTAFILSKIEELSNPEIAVIMNTSISSIESLVFRAKKALQEKLETKFENIRKKK